MGPQVMIAMNVSFMMHWIVDGFKAKMWWNMWMLFTNGIDEIVCGLKFQTKLDNGFKDDNEEPLDKPFTPHDFF